MEKNKIFAVDGDIVAYRCSAVCDGTYEGAVKSLIDECLINIATESKISYMRIYISGDNNFRYKVAKTKPYKGNRATLKRPEFLEAAKEHLISEYKAKLIDGYEADDAIATDMTVNDAIHCGIDKDIKQIPGMHYNYVKNIWEEISWEEATMLLYRQILTGDSSDNIPGLPLIGPAKAKKIIYDPNNAMKSATEFYHEYCPKKLPDIDPGTYFMEQALLVKLTTDVDLDFNNTVRIKQVSKPKQFQKTKKSKTDKRLML